jgi:steroid delta-isomerase-like uncharacterized protein
MSNPPIPDLVRRFYRDVWNAHDRRAIAELLTEDFRFRGSLGRECVGLAAFADYVDSVHRSLGDYRCEIEEMLSEGERAFARMSFSGTHRGLLLGHPATGKPVSWTGAALFHARDGKIESLWVLGDLDSLRRQLRADPWDIRRATADDVEAIARLHAESWRSAYRGSLSDEYLDERAFTDRLSLWSEKLSSHDSNSFLVLLASHDAEPIGFVCVILDEDETWGALLDNLHVLPPWKGKGLGKRLMVEAANWVASRRPGSPLHLWVIEENDEAQSFYRRRGGKPLDRKLWSAPDGNAVGLIRYVWNDATCVE